MSGESKIEWTDATWNPTTGCDRVSPGCDHCYAMTLAPRLKAMGSAHYQRDGDPKTSGPGFGVSVHPGTLDWPLRKTKPLRIFVNSMSDLFHDEIEADFIADVFATMALAPQHTFQVLTKRHGRMRSLLSDPEFTMWVGAQMRNRGEDEWETWPLPNVWVGVSVENQQWADIRIPALLDTPAAVRFLSCEPLLGPVCLDAFHSADGHAPGTDLPCEVWPDGIDWVIAGGESGPGARPMHPDWARALRDQCVEAGVAFHFKQWGEWAPPPRHPLPVRATDPRPWHRFDDNGRLVIRMGKKVAGRELDGRTWDEFPPESPLSSRRRADAGTPAPAPSPASRRSGTSTRASATATGQGISS